MNGPMKGSPLQVLAVPFDVGRRDTVMARGPAGLLAHGFQDRLRKDGWDVEIAEARIPEGLPKLATVTAVGRWIAAAESLERLRGLAEGRGLYLHVDMDGLDPGYAPAAGFPVPGGPSLEDVLRGLSVLPSPAALTFSALGFERAGEEEAARMVETCAKLVGIL